MKELNQKFEIYWFFQFLVKNINLDKKRLAATVQQYLAEGLLEIAKKFSNQNGIIV